jgi:uronate dehydrogenase
LGYRPKDNAEQFASEVFAEAGVLDSQDVGNMCHGGPFASVKLGNSGVATLNIINDTKKT